MIVDRERERKREKVGCMAPPAALYVCVLACAGGHHVVNEKYQLLEGKDEGRERGRWEGKK